MEPRSAAGSGVVTWHFGFDGPGLVAAVSSRAGGVSAPPYDSLNLGDHVGDDHGSVVENRRLLCEALGIGPFACPDQQHGTGVAVIGDGLTGAGYAGAVDAAERLPATDALVTAEPGVAIAIGAADCAPIVLHDPVRRVVAVVHAGRRGAVHDVVGATVATMHEAFGSRPEDLLAGIGPCIGWDSYEIGAPEIRDVAEHLGETVLVATRDGHARFDLPGAVRARLLRAGVRPERVEDAGIDTFRNTDRFFSDRAERPCGRMMLVAALR